MIFPLDPSTRRFVALSTTFMVAVVIGYLTLTPFNLQADVPGSDKLHHFVAFALLMLPCAVLSPRLLLILLPLGVLYGGVIEWYQPQIGRARETADFIADLAGALAGVTLGLGLRRLFGRRA